MIDLWQVLRATWMVALPPEQPSGVGVRKERLGRGDLLRLEPEQFAVVLAGGVTDRVSSAAGAVAVIGQYAARDPILMPVGDLRAEARTEVLVLLDGWQQALPEAAALVQMLTAAELLQTKRRLASVMTEPVGQRIRMHLLSEGIEPEKASPTEVARYVMCTRERASQVINQMRREAA